MSRTIDLGLLSSSKLGQIQQLIDRYEKAWAALPEGNSLDLSEFLPPRDAEERRDGLLQLVGLDIENRWKRGQVIGLEYYLEKFPELGTVGDLPVDLIYQEYRVRVLYGDRPQVESYRTRFPELFQDLQKRITERPVTPPSGSTGGSTMRLDSAGAAPSRKDVSAVGAAAGGILAVGGGFKLIRRIGSGGFGEVWLAEAPGGVEVAAKIIYRPIDHKDSQRESDSLELIKRLRHPFLLQTQSFFRLEDRLIIIMELADCSLRDRVKQCQREGLAGIPQGELAAYFREAAEALDYLHANQVQHRDIKPDNILLLQGHAKLADFGLARILEGPNPHTVSTSGTPTYMAPEIWRGKISRHSDQYSFALAYAELRLNRPVFQGKELMEIMLDHLQRSPDVSGLPHAEQQVVMKALSKNPEHRYESCLAFAQALPAPAAEKGAGYPARPGMDPVDPNESRDQWLARVMAAPTSAGVPASDTKANVPAGAPTIASEGPAATGPAPVYAPPRRPGDAAESLLERRGPHQLGKSPWTYLAMAIFLLAALGVGGYLVWFILWRVDFVPSGFESAPGAKVIRANGANVQDKIIRVLTTGDPGSPPLKAAFVLVLASEKGTRKSFYIMEKPVTRKQFLLFAETNKSAVRPEWHNDGPLVRQAKRVEEEDQPVDTITVAEARAFASWFVLGNVSEAERRRWSLVADLPTEGQASAAESAGANFRPAENLKQLVRPLDDATAKVVQAGTGFRVVLEFK